MIALIHLIRTTERPEGEPSLLAGFALVMAGTLVLAALWVMAP